jgi:hypothetical protein
MTGRARNKLTEIYGLMAKMDKALSDARPIDDSKYSSGAISHPKQQTISADESSIQFRAVVNRGVGDWGSYTGHQGEGAQPKHLAQTP